jgi:proteasome beta subunit
LRFGFRETYQGSSFSEYLRADHADLVWDPSRWLGHADTSSVPHGTTVLAFKYADGVMVAGDRLATSGMRVAAREMQKVYPTDNHSLIAIAGAAGPAIEMARLMRIELEHYEKIEGEALELDGKANKLSQMIRQNMPAAMQGLMVVPLFAGYDLRREQGRMWNFDVTGGRYEEAVFDSTGSGGLYAHESLKKTHHADASRSDALEMAVQALTDAADEDRATGGIDTVRGIYPLVFQCTQSGIEQAADSEIKSVYEGLMARRSERSGARSSAS